MRKLFYLIILVSTGFTYSCKKENKNSNTTTASTSLNLIKDSVYLYAAEDYLWNTSLPTYTTFNPRGFTGTDDISALSNELNALSQYAINPQTSKPYEYYADDPGRAKYSFIDDGTETAALNGVKGDFGFDLQYWLVNDLRIEYVYPNSPASMAGIKRSDEVLSINGSTSISYDATGYGTGTSTNLDFVSNAVYSSNTIAMKLQRTDGSTYSVNLTTASYNVNPVLKDTVLTAANGHKIGYMVFNSFVSDAVADPVVDPIISSFAAQGVTDLVVDLRYNGGGYVSTAEHLDNLIVPTAKNGTLMYNTYYNNNLVAGTDPLLAKQWRKDPSSGTDYNYAQFDYSVAGNAVNFAKTGSLNINRVFFIITGQTASASELTINNLRPEMDVQFVGETSYGKPVGFFDIDINKYIMYTPEFYVQNSANQGGYYAGFTPGASGYPGVNDVDDLTKNFGDPTEGLLADIINYVNTGTYAVKTPIIQSLGDRRNAFSLQAASAISINKNLHRFTGLVFNKKLKLRK